MNVIKLYIGILILGVIWLFSDVKEAYVLFTESKQAKYYFEKEGESLQQQSEKKLKELDNILTMQGEGARKYYAHLLILENESVDSISTVVDKYTDGIEGYWGYDKCNRMKNFQKQKLMSFGMLPTIEKFENRLNYNNLSNYLVEAIVGSGPCFGPRDYVQKDFLNDSIYYIKMVGFRNYSKFLLEINGQTFDDYSPYDFLTIKKEKEIDIKYSILTLEDERTRIDTIFKHRRFSLEL